MPNGGSDCCGTCWFNSKNDGEPGYHGAEKPGKVRCIIRDIEPENPFYTYCANHPHHNKLRIEVPLGPVFINEDREIWLLPPVSEDITGQLLALLDTITNEVQKRYPSPTDLEEIIIDQLMSLKENRAIPGLLNIAHLEIKEFLNYKNEDHYFIRNKAIIVGKAIEAILFISEGKNLSDVDFFIDAGLERFNQRPYDQKKDNFSYIRYHLVSGLQYCPFYEIEDLLEIAVIDPSEKVRNKAVEIQSQMKSAAKKSAYGRRRGTAIVETDQGIMVVTHDNHQFLLPGGSPKPGELQIQSVIRELREETGLRAYDVQYLFTHMSAKVFRIQAEGNPEPRNEINAIEYYREGSPVNVSNNTRLIIEKYLKNKDTF